MKKYFLLLILVSSIIKYTIAQNNDKLKAGGYKYAFEYKNNSPSIDCQFIIEARTLSDIIENGGNDYRISSVNDLISLNEIKKELWGVFDGDSLYINAYPYTGYDWYAKVLVVGKYLYFKGIPPLDKKIQKKIGYKHDSYVFVFGVLGGVVGGVVAGMVEETQNSIKRIPFLLNVESGKAIYLTKDRLYQLITDYPDLKQEYFAENEVDNEKVIIKYIKKLNEKDHVLSLSAEDIDDQIKDRLEKQLVDLKESLYKTDTDTSYQNYYQKILKLALHPEFVNAEIVYEKYPNGNIKSIGIKAKHKLGKIEDDIYSNTNYFNKIGTWRYFHENGQLWILVDYDLTENKSGRYIEYDNMGNILKETDSNK